MVNIALATDQNLFPYLRVVVNSTLAHTKEPVTFYVLTRNISSEQFRQHYPECIQIPMDTVTYGNLKLAKWVTQSTMDRIFLPSLLHVDKVVYLDIDVVVLDDIKWLFDYKTGECGLAAKRSTRVGYLTNVDYARRTNINFKKVKNLCGTHPNFNAGVLVMDLKRLKEYGMQEFCLALIEETHCNDQIALASYSRGRFSRIPDRWNTWAGIDHKKISHWGILHYVGQDKPWHPETKLNEYWNRYAGTQRNEV